MFAAEHLCIARYAIVAADGVDRRDHFIAFFIVQRCDDNLAAAVDSRRDQIQHAAGVQPAIKAQGVAIAQRAVALQHAVFHQGVTHHQRRAAGIDKAAAVATDAVRVSQHVVGRHAEDFLLSVQQRRVAADHFIEDHAGRLVVQVRVGSQLAGQLRPPGIERVIQHRAGLVDVEILILVM
ncbi:hypothetical protein D3C72_1133160 [compost metagenome]